MSIELKDQSTFDLREIRSMVRQQVVLSLGGMTFALVLILGLGMYAELPLVQVGLCLTAVMIAGGHASSMEYKAYMRMMILIPLLVLGALQPAFPTFSSGAVLSSLANLLVWSTSYAALIVMAVTSFQLWAHAFQRIKRYAHARSSEA